MSKGSLAPLRVVAFLMEWEPQLGMQEAVATVRSKHPVACRPFPFQEMLRSFQYFLDGLRRRPEEQSAPAELDVRKASEEPEALTPPGGCGDPFVQG